MRIYRLTPEDRRAKILPIALKLAVDKGYTNLTVQDVAEATGLSRGTINHHFGNVAALRSAVVELALVKRRWPVIAQAVVAKAPEVKDLPADIRAEALRRV